MKFTIQSGILAGRSFVPVKVEVDITKGIGIHLVGLADASVKETLLRTVTALQSKGYRFPGEKVVINIAPADLRKSNTSGLDLPIALGILYATGQRPLPKDIDKYLVCGELGLDGTIRATAGGVLMAEYCHKQGLTAVMPRGNTRELFPFYTKKEYAVLIPGTVDEAADMFEDSSDGAAIREENDFYKVMEAEFISSCEKSDKDSVLSSFERLAGVEQRAVLIAAAGGFDMLAVGDRGRLIAHALHEILPTRAAADILETAKNYSALSCGWNGIREANPFRDLNEYAGVTASWNECVKAHGGVLFVENTHLLSMSVRDLLCVVRHDREVKITRLTNKSVYPADFQTVLVCSEDAAPKAVRYTAVEYPELPATVEIFALEKNRPVPGEMNAQEAMGTVLRVRDIQKSRGEGLTARLSTRDSLSIYNAISPECGAIIDRLQTALGLRASRLADLCKIARTIADIDGSGDIRTEHFAEAASYLFFTK